MVCPSEKVIDEIDAVGLVKATNTSRLVLIYLLQHSTTIAEHKAVLLKTVGSEVLDTTRIA